MCKKQFRTNRCVKRIAAVHEKLKPYKCHLCEKKISQEHYVKIHIGTVHKKIETLQMSLV